MIDVSHFILHAPSAYVQVQATAQPAGPGNRPADPSVPSPNSAPAGAPQPPPNTGQAVAPAAGAAGQSEAATTSATPAGHVAPASDNGGNLAGKDVPGGVNHAPAEGKPAQSFSAPIKKD